MNRITAFVLSAGLAMAGALPLTAPIAGAHTVEAGGLMMVHPTSRPSMPNRPGVVYVRISNDGVEADRLIAVSAPGFASAEIHESAMVNGMMTMHPVEGIDLPAGEAVELAPGGYHIMLFGGQTLYKPGDMFPVVLTFQKAGDITVEVMVEKLDPAAMGGMGAGHSGHGTMEMPKPSN